MNESMQSRGGLARAAKLTPKERSEIASGAANTRWAGPRQDKEFKALSTIVRHIESLGGEEKKRVFDYLKSRYKSYLQPTNPTA